MPVSSNPGPKTPSAREILKKIRRIELKTRAMVDAALSGQYRSVFKGRGMNFDEVREYQPGDEVRSIDWNVTARYGDAYVKKFKEERELTVFLIVDVSASGEFGSVEQSKRELAAEVACVLAFSAIRNQDKVGLILFSDHVEHFIAPKKGRSHILRMIRDILFFEPTGHRTDAGAALKYANRVLARRSVVFLISDFQTPDMSRELSLTARRHDLVAISIYDRWERELPNVGLITLEDPETGEMVELDTRSEAFRKTAAEAFRKEQAGLEQMLRKLQIDSIALRTHEDYLPALRTFFRIREKRMAHP